MFRAASRIPRAPLIATLITLALRAVYLLQIRENPYFLVPVMDEGYHDQWAREIAAGNLTAQIPFFRAPLYPFLLGLGYRLFGPDLGFLRALGLLFGAMTPALTWVVARRIVPGRPGVAAAAALVVAVDGILQYFEAELLLESLLAPFGMILVLLVLRAGENGSAARWGLAGLMLGGFAITRPNILLFAPVAFLLALGWVGDEVRLRRFRWKPAAALTLGTCALVLPVTAINGLVGGDPVLVASQGGLNFFLGNNPEANGWSATAPSIMRLDWWGALQDATEIAETEAGRPLRPSEISDYWYRRSLDWWRREPRAALTLTLQKVTFFLGGIEFSNNRNIDLFFEEYAPLGLPSLYLAYFGVPLALVGAIAVWRRGGWAGRAAILLGAAYSISVVIFFVTARYRIPVRPLFAILGAEGARVIVVSARAGGWRGWVPAAAAVLLGVALNANAWTKGYTPNPAQFFQSVANVLRDRGDLDGALASQERALSLEPGYPKGNLNLGTMYMTRGRLPEAILAFRREIALDPADGQAHASLAQALDRSGKLVEAEREYAAASAAGLEEAPARYNHALCLERLDRPDEAADLYRRAIAADSTFVEAWNNLGVHHARNGRLEEAIRHWEKVLEIRPDHERARENLERARARVRNRGGESDSRSETGG